MEPLARTPTPVALPSMRTLSRIATDLAAATSLTAAVVRLQRDLSKLLSLTDALCFWIDWPRHAVWSTNGAVGEQSRELITDIAGSGRRELVGNTLLQPVGARPARAVFGLRRPSGAVFELPELAMISTLAMGLAPALDRLIAADR